MAKLQRNPSTGKLSRNPVTGKLQTDSGIKSCILCQISPNTLRLDLSGFGNKCLGTCVFLVPFWTAFGGTSPSFDLAAHYDGTHDLTLISESPCTYSLLRVPTPTVSVDAYTYGSSAACASGGCAGTLAGFPILSTEITWYVSGVNAYIRLDTRLQGPLLLRSEWFAPLTVTDCWAGAPTATWTETGQGILTVGTAEIIT